VKNLLRKVWRASIWHPDAIHPAEFKYRNLKRIWLPLYDLIAVWAGINAVLYGSTLLNRLFPDPWVDVLGGLFTVVAVICLIAVAFPCLWAVEIVGKVLLVSLIAGYIATIVFFSTAPQPQLFVVGVLAFGLPLALFRLNLLGEEVKQRRVVTDE
jgi:hypothetical protein